ncbi:hypothetical protein NE237_026118 [Protea cynaroides]|uniref:K Homology domain-containing protein n=1 Tax=Protea cynaroides TaxID=273540 RepID=A0A9Q0H7J4_9MAGN|nr:hypothetical protein NE237_026118 [Protea cynaroides]
MIKIADAIAPYEERVIIISSVDKDSKVSEAENALHLIASIILTDEDVNAVASVAGSLIGMSGQNIEILRNESGTSIMILGQNQFPLCASAHDSDRMVQISVWLQHFKKSELSLEQWSRLLVQGVNKLRG